MGTTGRKWTTSRERCEKHIEKERKRREIKQTVNLMYAQGYTLGQIAEKLNIPEGAARNYISVNGGF